MTPEERSPVVARVLRSAFVESEHRGVVAVAGESGPVSGFGDGSLVIALRSSAKPFQLIPLVESGAADAFGFTPPELAVMAGSHAGRAEHVHAVRSALHRAGLDESYLRCGAHLPFDSDAAEELARFGLRPLPVHNNCSGKHTAMLALAKHLREPLGSYTMSGHAAQQAILSAVAWACGVEAGSIGLATDGCSAPTFFVPISSAASAFARLAAAGGGDSRSVALARIRDAMIAHPEMVAGPGRFDSIALTEMNGLYSKGGAEGVQGLAVKLVNGRAIGLMVKILDGSGRAAGPVVLETLRQLIGPLPGKLEGLRAPVTANHQGTEVGRLQPEVTLSAA